MMRITQALKIISEMAQAYDLPKNQFSEILSEIVESSKRAKVSTETVDKHDASRHAWTSIQVSW